MKKNCLNNYSYRRDKLNQNRKYNKKMYTNKKVIFNNDYTTVLFPLCKITTRNTFITNFIVTIMQTCDKLFKQCELLKWPTKHVQQTNVKQ